MPDHPSSLFQLLLFISILHLVNSSDNDTLLDFKNSLINGDKLTTWNPLTTPCDGNTPNWDGLLCANDTVWGIRLEGKELGRTIDTKILTKLPSLLTISFQNNSFEGGFPEFKRLRGLRSIFLTANRFSGEIPANAFDGMKRLKKLYLANNKFHGKIPASLTTLPKLRDLLLENNRFEGEIPMFVKDNLTIVNFTNNNLRGPIPKRLQEFPASQFSGNGELCGAPLGTQCKVATSTPDSSSTSPSTSATSGNNTSTTTTIITVLVVVAAVVAIAAAFIILQQFGPSSTNCLQVSACKKGPSSEHNEMEQGCATATAVVKKADALTFLRDDVEKFNLAELLKASAVILGGGAFGSSYKAVLSRQRVVVVKKFEQMNNVTKDEFVNHMQRLGKLDHPNVLPVIAFYYRREEKLFVVDYVENISLAVHLHGNRSSGSQSLDWPTRLKIVKGIARGLIHLYNELPSLIAPHGHLKSSNVLLNREFEPLLTDYGLVPITNHEQARQVMIAFKSPEYKKQGRITKKTDVWSLGVMIIEIMTGKLLANSFNQGKGGDTELADFVDSMMKEEELTTDVFDKEMGEFDKGNEEEMVKLLKIGLSCCEPDVDKRWDIKEVVDIIENVKEKNDDGDTMNDDDRQQR
ncbi:pollen receptor-like kinase 4 [Cynara cardunculus var. scolymus]|uniref:pollen receptor-like kinase 4 n=1 Tax=Cynara cardunculus var. scolymus TaxID=59895 RepID=UPI000D627ADF|nr:pollen receptor-like kinase 4 [Cynara cardunculus var. scolymus]